MMFGLSGDEFLWYQRGRQSAEESARLQEAGNLVFGRPRVVQVEQSYLDSLHAELANSRNISSQNYNIGTSWMNKANRVQVLLDKAYAKADEQYDKLCEEWTQKQEYKGQVQRLQAELDAALATAERERQAKEKLKKEYNKSKCFAFILVHILDALIPAAEDGKASRPDYKGIKGYFNKLLTPYRETWTPVDAEDLLDEKYFELEESIKF
jgi:hypothetical protein